MQKRVTYSDPAMEEALYEIASLRHVQEIADGKPDNEGLNMGLIMSHFISQ